MNTTLLRQIDHRKLADRIIIDILPDLRLIRSYAGCRYASNFRLNTVIRERFDLSSLRIFDEKSRYSIELSSIA